MGIIWELSWDIVKLGHTWAFIRDIMGTTWECIFINYVKLPINCSRYQPYSHIVYIYTY